MTNNEKELSKEFDTFFEYTKTNLIENEREVIKDLIEEISFVLSHIQTDVDKDVIKKYITIGYKLGKYCYYGY